MKKTSFLSLVCFLLICLTGAAQYDSPAVAWKKNDIAPHSPDNSPIIFQHQPSPPGYDLGSELYDPSAAYPTYKTGEDWWYSVTTAEDNGEVIGYYTCGFTHFMFVDVDDTNEDGCIYQEADGPETVAEIDKKRPLLLNEKMSGKLAVVGLYDKKGKMVWCRSLFTAREGAYSCISDQNGDVIVTGWTDATVDIGGSPVLFNPQGASSGDNLNDLGYCEMNQVKMFVAKLNKQGDLIWVHLYSMYDLINPDYTTQEVVGAASQGVDLVLASNGNYVILGNQNDPENQFLKKLFALELNASTGKIEKRTELEMDGYSVTGKFISSYGTDYIVGGYSEDRSDVLYPPGGDPNLVPTIARAHGFACKLNDQLTPYSFSVFGTDGKITTHFNGIGYNDISVGYIWLENDYQENTADVTNGRSNVIRDAKKLANNNIATVSFVDCNGCRNAGANRAIGELRIYNSIGTSMVSSVSGINGEARFLINETGGGMVNAFDIMLGLEPKNPNEITLIGTVDEGTMTTGHSDYSTFLTSMDIISSGSSTTISDFIEQGEYTPRGGSPYDYDISQTSAILANYNIDGELRWEKIIDIDDANMQEYPGDWKEQECVYQIVQDPEDGGYVFIGNTSHNKDDYLIAKVHGNCLLDIDYDVTPPDPLVDNTYIIGGGGTVTWNPTTFGGQTEIYARGEIHIESGTTLSINSGLIVHFADGTQMDLDTRLIVEPGAQLFVTGGAVLTSTDCPNAMWRGIEVWGDKDLPQNTINQGYVRLIGNATIENAYDGVRLWKPNDWTSMGGIVRATNAHFLNNWRDVEFIAYANINNLGVEQPNQSFFINTDFVTTDAYKLDDYIADHVTMYKVHGVKYLRCDFTDDRTAPTFAAQNKGIFSIDAGYKVLGTFSGATPTLSEYFDGTNWNECTFTNLETGIEALNANSQESITVDQSLFTDCRFGIRLNKVDNAFVTRNKYEVTGSAPLLYASNYGVLLQNCTGYQVEGNIINNDVIGGTGVLGISIDDSGLEDNDVYKNQFNNNHYATYSFDKNRNDAPANSPNIEGLEFLCNDHVDNLIVDELVYGFDPLDGEKVIQGSLPSPARNVFSDVSSGLDYHIAKYVDEDLYYIWNSANSNEEPSLVTPGVFTANINDPLASCPTNFTTVVPGPGKPLTPVVRAQLETDFGTVNDLHQLKIAEFDALQANGDRPELHQAVASLTPATKLQVKNLLLAEAPYLSRSLLEELADKAPGYFPNVWLKDIIIANIDLARERDFRDYLLTKSSPMPTGLYNQIESSLPSITERTEKQMEVVDLNKEKQQIANFILKDITQDSVGVDLAEYNEWVTKRGDIVCEFQIADKFLSRTLKDSCMNHLLKIDDQVSQMSASELKTELEDYSAFKKQMLVLTNDDGFLEGLDEVSEPIIRYYAENSIGTPQAQAQNLLCFFLGECDEAPPIPTLSGKLMAMYLNNSDAPSEFVKESMFEVYPNPNDGSFTIKSDSKGIVHVRDLSGRLVYEGILTDGSLNVDLRKLNAGVYLVQLIVRNEIIDVQKLIKR